MRFGVIARTTTAVFVLGVLTAPQSLWAAKNLGFEPPVIVDGKPLPTVVASVNGKPVTAKLLQRELTAFRMMSKQQGREVKPEEEGKILKGLLMKAIDNELIFQKGQEKHIEIPSETIERELKQIQDQFPSEKLFLHALKLQHLTPETLKESILRELTKEEFIRMEIAPQVKLEEGAVEAFYKQNRKSFLKPATYHIRHIYVGTMNPSMEGKAENPADQKRADSIMEWVNQEARKKIDEANAKLKAGEDFAKVVEKYSEDEETRETGGDMGFLSAQQTNAEIHQALKTLQVGETSGVIESPFGYHIINLVDKNPETPVAFKEVKTDILNHLLRVETEKQIAEYLSRLRKISDIQIFI